MVELAPSNRPILLHVRTHSRASAVDELKTPGQQIHAHTFTHPLPSSQAPDRHHIASAQAPPAVHRRAPDAPPSAIQPACGPDAEPQHCSNSWSDLASCTSRRARHSRAAEPVAELSQPSSISSHEAQGTFLLLPARWPARVEPCVAPIRVGSTQRHVCTICPAGPLTASFASRRCHRAGVFTRRADPERKVRATCRPTGLHTSSGLPSPARMAPLPGALRPPGGSRPPPYHTYTGLLAKPKPAGICNALLRVGPACSLDTCVANVFTRRSTTSIAK